MKSNELTTKKAVLIGAATGLVFPFITLVMVVWALPWISKYDIWFVIVILCSPFCVFFKNLFDPYFILIMFVYPVAVCSVWGYFFARMTAEFRFSYKTAILVLGSMIDYVILNFLLKIFLDIRPPGQI